MLTEDGRGSLGRTSQFGKFAGEWLAHRPGVRPRTSELSDCLLRLYLVPEFE